MVQDHRWGGLQGVDQVGQGELQVGQGELKGGGHEAEGLDGDNDLVIAFVPRYAVGADSVAPTRSNRDVDGEMGRLHRRGSLNDGGMDGIITVLDVGWKLGL